MRDRSPTRVSAGGETLIMVDVKKI
jgi:hypothetical protein